MSKRACLQLEFIDAQGSDKKRGATILKNWIKITLSIKSMPKNSFIKQILYFKFTYKR